MLIACAYASSGQGIIQGSVVDEHAQPIVGVNVSVAGHNIGLVSDRSGRFNLKNVPTGENKIILSFIGYETQTVAVSVENNIVSKVSVVMIEGLTQLSDVVVTSSHDRPINTLSSVDIKLRPVNTSQDILRMVPGLFIAQHAGGGKAEQIFLRGFDCDHGTDINIEVDGLPVNMVSHAHGQGYADLHFLMPELVSYVDFDKGPYFADKGDLNTAGYVAFQTKSRLDKNFIKLEGGSFKTGRIVGGMNFIDNKKTNAYFATEYFGSEGFFESSQKFRRFNFQTRINSRINDRLSLTAALSAFSSKWNASGQIPDRAVEEGIITRFGSIDPTEGGNTDRFNAYVKLIRSLNNGGSWENQVYAVRYDFSLYSNFTFYLNDPVNGDQIRQIDHRWIYGYKSRYENTSSWLGKTLKSDVGAGFRYDDVNGVTLDHTVQRTFLNHEQYGDVNELNANAYVSETLFLTDKFSINGALRFDYFHFAYRDRLAQSNLPNVGKAIVSPKINFTYQPSERMSFFVRSGTGFHSNDARVVVVEGGTETLPRAYGVDVGGEFKVTPTLLLHLALWRLDLDQEFVYVGDEGIAEPSGKTKREGIDLSARYQLTSWLFADLDFNLTRPRAKDVPEGENYIPLAPVISSVGGLTVRRNYGLNGSLRYRFIGDRPANETNTVVARGYFIVDAVLNYSRKSWEAGFSIENPFNREWDEAQFDTESRLQNETDPVSEIHFTPGTPFALRLRFTKYF